MQRQWVTPCVGVWIEIVVYGKNRYITKSLPAWGCGLKYIPLDALHVRQIVTPCVGVWIEISMPIDFA